MDRENIINLYSKSDFMDFLESDREGKILELFNEEGINIISKSSLKKERISYILTYSSYKNELLQNVNFLDMFLNTDITYYYASLGHLDFKTYNIILKRCIELNKDVDMIAKLFSYFNIDYKLNIIEEKILSQELIYNILKVDNPQVIQKIIENYNIDLLSHDINLQHFFSNAKESVLIAQAKRNLDELSVSSIEVPSTMITKEMADSLWDKYDIFAIRAIINDAEYCTDASLLNSCIKKKEDQIINNCLNSRLVSPFDEIYETFKKCKIEEKKFEQGIINDDREYYNYRRKIISLLNKIGDQNIFYELNKLYNENNFDELETRLEVMSNNTLSNYIIDYHFEENYHNIMIDMRELLQFYYDGHIALPEERVELYNKTSNIDYLTTEEKLELYIYLKNFNMIEQFYDDMAMARYIVAEAIKEYSLSSGTLKQYRDDKLSEQYGVDVYVVNGNPFFGIVKTGRHRLDELPAGHSYSLIGNAGIAVFGDPKDSRTYLYDADSMNPEQLVHAFPYDSYTYYHPFEYSTNATSRVNIFAMPDELVETSSSYNELLILEKGKRDMGTDEFIPELKRIALYCLDEIREQDVRIAKEENVGIFLIDSSKYKKERKRNFSSRHGIDSFECDYFNGVYERDKFEARR